MKTRSAVGPAIILLLTVYALGSSAWAQDATCKKLRKGDDKACQS